MEIDKKVNSTFENVKLQFHLSASGMEQAATVHLNQILVVPNQLSQTLRFSKVHRYRCLGQYRRRD